MAASTSTSPVAPSTAVVADSSTSTPVLPSQHLLELPIAAPLSHDLFLDAAFSPDAFLLSRRHTSLDDLRSDLRSYLTSLRAELVALINEDYEDFIGLGMGLRGTVERALGRMRLPVDEVRSEVQGAKEALEEVKAEVEEQLEERRKIREGKKLVKVILDCGEAVAKVEDMLGIAAVPAPTGKEARRQSVSLLRRPVPALLDDHGFDSGTKRIERVAAEFNQTLYLVSLAKGSAYVASLAPRIERARSALQRDLAALFRETLKSSDRPAKKEALIECLRTYETLGLVREAEDLVKREVVLPGLAEVVEPSALHGGLLSPVLPVTPFSALSKRLSFPDPASATANASTGATTGYEPLTVPEDTEAASLPTLYNKLLAFVARELAQVVDIADRQLTTPSGQRPTSPSDAPSSSTTGFDMFRHAVVAPILQSLASTLGQTLFASGNPALFHRHFSQTQLFLSRLEGFCSSEPQVVRLRQDPEWVAFGNRWQLAVYAQLRTRETVAKLEEALTDGKGEVVAKRSAPGLGYSMKATEATHLAIKTIWQDEVFLPELAHRFWRLTLQILSRYRTWLQTALPAYHAPSSTTGAALTAPSNAPASTRKSFDAGRRDGNARTATPAEEEANEDVTLHELAIFVADMQKLQDNGLVLFAERIGPRLPTAAAGGKGSSAEALMRSSLASTTSIIPSLSSQVTNILIKRCAERLRFIRSVGSSARAARTMPSAPSYFVADILKDLRSFLDGPARIVSAPMRQVWATAVADEIASRYAGILLNIQKTEDSLRKIKKGRQGFSLFGRSSAAAQTDPAGTSEEDAKVKRQMQLDVDRLAAEAEAAGVSVQESKAFAELRRTLEEEPGRTAA